MAHNPEANKNNVDVQAAAFPWNGETMQFAELAYRNWLRGAETVQSQALEFWNAEMQKGIEAMNLMAQCTTAAEAFGVQTRFATQAVQDFINGSQKVVEQFSALTGTPWAAQAAMVQAAADEAAEATTTRSSRRRS
jgi:hypothetical protein